MSHDPENSCDKKNAATKPNSSSKTSENDKGSHAGISGDEIVDIVKDFGGTDLNAMVEGTLKTIEASLRSSAKLFDALAQYNNQELLAKQCVQCGLNEIVAAALAMKLIDKATGT